MTITDVAVTIPEADRPRVLCYASLVLGGCLKVRNLRLIDLGGRGPYLAMPSRRSGGPGGAGEHRDVCHPTCPELRAAMTAAVVAAYREAVAARAGAGARERAWAEVAS